MTQEISIDGAAVFDVEDGNAVQTTTSCARRKKEAKLYQGLKG